MIIEDRVKAFVQLGEFIKNLPIEKFKTLAESIRIENAWFTEASLRMAVSGIAKYLDEENLRKWLKNYTLAQRPSKVILLIMAGNIPLAGFHDLLCVLINGDAALIKVSSKDSILIKLITDKLIDINEEFADKIKFEPLKNFDAVIATGSDNSSRYFDYYFGKYPHIIRKNRTSVAILNGHENEGEIRALGADVFTYFGLGCRNISKLFFPAGFDFHFLFKNWDSYNDISFHYKYNNNYHYQKSILTVSGSAFLDNGFVLLQENEKLVSPIAVIYYQYYNDQEELKRMLQLVNDKLQCVVGNFPPSLVRFGETQTPGLDDYADQVDTMRFLQSVIR
jgi:Acyl-CoA reductase (LuxC)